MKKIFLVGLLIINLYAKSDLYNSKKVYIKRGFKIEETKVSRDRGTELNIYAKDREKVFLYLKLRYDKDGMLDGKQYEYRVDKSIRFIQTYKNGAKTGRQTGYYESGKVWNIGDYKDGKLNGEKRDYSEDGSLSSTTEYKNGKRDGVYKSYDNKGRLSMYETYSKGERITATWYYGDGSLMYKVGIRKGDKILSIGYYEDGKIKTKNIRNTKGTVRVYREFYQNGQISLLEHYRNWKKEGARERYNKEGKIIEIKYYHKDKEISKREYEKLNIKK